MKMLFIYPDLVPHVVDWPGYYHNGIGVMSAVLKQAGHGSSLLHIVQPMSWHDFINRVREEAPALIGFSATSHMFPVVKELVSWLQDAKLRIPVMCGGIHPTIAPDDAIGVDGIDIICRGEGEGPLLELCQRLENKSDICGIQNLWIKKDDGTVIKNPLRPIVNDLDIFPFSDRAAFNYSSLYSEREGRGSFMASRGCPHNCTYCCNQLIRSIYGSEGKAIRFRSVDNVIAEIKQVLNEYPFIKSLVFDDDILFLNRKWSEEFADKYSREIKLPFMCNARADVTDQSLVDRLKKAGCYYVRFGLESGNEEIRYNVLDRRMKNEQIKKAFSMCKEAGFTTFSYNIVGFPHETPSSILDTIKLNAAIDVDVTHVTIFQPYPGTKLYDLCREMNLIESKDLAQDFCSPSVLQLTTVSPSQVLMFRNYFRVFMKYYQFLDKLPRGVSRICIKLSDRLLSFHVTAQVLNSIYAPLYRMYLRSSFKRDREKKAFTIKEEKALME